MASTRADPIGGHTGPAPWTAGGQDKTGNQTAKTKAQPPKRPAAEVPTAGDQSRAMMLDIVFSDNT